MEEKNETTVKFPKKLRCVSGKDLVQKTNGSLKRQANYYETGSSLSEEEIEEIKLPEINPEISEQILNEITVMDEIKTELIEINEETTKKIRKKKPKLVTKNMANDDLEEKDTEVIKKDQVEEFFKILSKIKGSQVTVPRLDAIESVRSKLPIHAEEQQIIEAINENTVCFIFINFNKSVVLVICANMLFVLL